MDNISYVNVDALKFPQGSKGHDKLIVQMEKQSLDDNEFVLCFGNTYHKMISKTKRLSEVIRSQFYIPFIENESADVYEQSLNMLRMAYFDKTVASIPNIKVVAKGVAEMSPQFSQLCAGTMLTDKKGRVLVLIDEIGESEQVLRLPQTHLPYSQDMYTKTLEEYICDFSNKALNDAIHIERIEGELEPISLLSGCIVNTSATNASAMHTLFATIYQIDDFENYNVRCVNESQRAMILELNEAVEAVQGHLLDPWLSYIFKNTEI